MVGTHVKLFIYRKRRSEKSEMIPVRSPSLSLWNSFKKSNNLSLFLRKILAICGGLFGLATKTYASL